MEINIDREFVLHHMPRRPRSGHKGTFGSLLLLAGSTCYRGAAVLAAEAALRAGAGLVRLASTEEVCAAATTRLPGCILRPLPGNAAGGIAQDGLPLALEGGQTAMLAGSGITTSQDSAVLVYALLKAAPCPMVLDADAITLIAGHVDGVEDDALREEGLNLLRNATVPRIITPHVGEMARLTGMETTEVAAAQAEVAARFATQTGCTVVLKSHQSVVASPAGGVFVLDMGGNPGLSRGGSGDVLAGIIASLLAQGFPPEVAGAAGVWLHAEAGRKAAALDGEAGLSVASLPGLLGEVWRELGR